MLVVTNVKWSTKLGLMLFLVLTMMGLCACSAIPDRSLDDIKEKFRPVIVSIEMKMEALEFHYYGQWSDSDLPAKEGIFQISDVEALQTPISKEFFVWKQQTIVYKGFLYLPGANFMYGKATITLKDPDTKEVLKTKSHIFNRFFGDNNSYEEQRDKSYFDLSIDL